MRRKKPVSISVFQLKSVMQQLSQLQQGGSLVDDQAQVTSSCAAGYKPSAAKRRRNNPATNKNKQPGVRGRPGPKKQSTAAAAAHNPPLVSLQTKFETSQIACN